MTVEQFFTHCAALSMSDDERALAAVYAPSFFVAGPTGSMTFANDARLAGVLTLGAVYEERPRLSGGAYNPVLRRIEDFLDERLSRALKERARRAALVLAIDDEVARIVEKLKKRRFTSPYLRPFIVARINPIRFSKSTEFDFDDVLGRMKKNAEKFNVDRVRQEDVVRAGGAVEGPE